MVSPHSALNMPPITFTLDDFKGIEPVQDDRMAISIEIVNCIIKKTFVDQGSLADILFQHTFKQMEIPESKILSHDDPLFGFAGEQVGTNRCIWLYIKFEHKGPLQKRLKITYVIMLSHTSYNMFLGRPSLNALDTIFSIPYLDMKFWSDSGTIITVHVDQRMARECYMTSLRLHSHAKEEAPKFFHYIEAKTKIEEVEELEHNLRTNDDNWMKPVEETSTFQLNLKEGQVAQLRNQLFSDNRSRIQRTI